MGSCPTTLLLVNITLWVACGAIDLIDCVQEEEGLAMVRYFIALISWLWHVTRWSVRFEQDDQVGFCNE